MDTEKEITEIYNGPKLQTVPLNTPGQESEPLIKKILKALKLI